MLKLSKIPAWEDLSDDEDRLAVSKLVDTILDEHEKKPGSAPNVVDRVRSSDPTHRPAKAKRSPKPVCHAASREERGKYRQLRREFVNAYVRASELLREGEKEALRRFPPCSFLPPLGLDVLM